MQKRLTLTEPFGALRNGAEEAKSLEEMVSAWGFEPQTPTVSSRFWVSPEGNRAFKLLRK
jgi:hypothetical protein